MAVIISTASGIPYSSQTGLLQEAKGGGTIFQCDHQSRDWGDMATAKEC